jgi:hypothetical protein
LDICCASHTPTPTPLRRFETLFDGFCTSKEEVKSANLVERGGVIVHLNESTVVAHTAPTMYEILALVPEGRAIVPPSSSKHRFVVLGAVGVLAKHEFNQANFPQEFAALGDKPPLQYVFAFFQFCSFLFISDCCELCQTQLELTLGVGRRCM